MAAGRGRTCHGAFGQALFNEPLVSSSPDSVVLVRDITFAALSEDSLLPFHGRCHVAYVPQSGVVLGLSKLARATRCLAARVQTQGQLASDLLEAVQQAVAPNGVAVVITATHLGGPAGPAVRCSVASTGCLGAEKGRDALEEVLMMLGIDDLAAVEACHTEATELQPEGRIPDGHLATSNSTDADVDATLRMVGAVDTLLRGVGEDPSLPALQGSALRYVRWLQSATAGYGMDPFAALPPSSSGAGAPPTSSAPADIGPGTPDVASIESSDASSDDMPLDPGACFVNLREWRGGPRADLGCSAGSLPPGRDVCVISLPFASQCEHHLLPFYGTARVAFLAPNAATSKADTGRRLAHIVATYSKRLQVQERLTQQIADAAAAALGADAAVLVVVDSAHMCMVARGVEEHASATMTTAARGSWAARPATRKAALQALLTMGAT